MSPRTRLALAGSVTAVVGGLALALPVQAMVSARPLPIQVGVTSRGEVCYSANPDGSNVHCTDPVLR